MRLSPMVRRFVVAADHARPGDAWVAVALCDDCGAGAVSPGANSTAAVGQPRACVYCGGRVTPSVVNARLTITARGDA